MTAGPPMTTTATGSASPRVSRFGEVSRNGGNLDGGGAQICDAAAKSVPAVASGISGIAGVARRAGVAPRTRRTARAEAGRATGDDISGYGRSL